MIPGVSHNPPCIVRLLFDLGIVLNWNSMGLDFASLQSLKFPFILGFGFGLSCFCVVFHNGGGV